MRPLDAIRTGVNWATRHAENVAATVKEKVQPIVNRVIPEERRDGIEKTDRGANRAAWAHPGDGVELHAVAAAKQAPAKAPPVDAGESAKRVLEAGSRPIVTDDYEKRTEVLAQELERGDAEFREKLMSEIIKRDRGALDSWLQPGRVNALARDNRISGTQRAHIAEGLADLYNKGKLPTHTIDAGQIPGKVEHGKTEFSPLDNVVGGYSVGSRDPAHDAQRVRDFLDLMTASNEPKMVMFRQDYAKHLLDQQVLPSTAGYYNPTRRDAAAGLAANLLAANPPEMTVTLLSKYGDKLPDILKAAKNSTGVYGADVMKTPAMDANLDVARIAVPDGAEALLRNIAAAKKTPASEIHGAPDALAARALSESIDKVALSSAQLAAQAPEIFTGKDGKGRADALTMIVANNHQVILDTLTPYDRHATSSKDGKVSSVYRENAKVLGSLLDVTMFNPDVSASTKGLLQDKMIDYVKGQMKAINESTGASGDAAGRVAMLEAALLDAVKLGADKNAADKARTKEALGFLLDLAVSALPAGKLISEPVEEYLKSAFGNPLAGEALKNVWKTGYDKATGKLTADAKKAVLDKLSPGDRNVQLEVDFLNGMQEVIQRQISAGDKDSDYADININAEGIGNSLDFDRGRKK